MSRLAIITGITSQDGSYLAQLLLQKGYRVHGLCRDMEKSRARLASFLGFPVDKITLQETDITDANQMGELIRSLRPDEVYNLAAQSSPARSVQNPRETVLVNAICPLNIMEAIREAALAGTTRFFQASSAEIFTDRAGAPQNEQTPLGPRNPYGASKALAHCLVGSYRASHGLFASSGILYNHESDRRGKQFVTMKIRDAVAEALAGGPCPVTLGNLSARRDWGWAPDYVHGMWLALQAKSPEDFVFATGTAHTVRDFVEAMFRRMGNVTLRWEGRGVEEKGYDTSTGKMMVAVNQEFFRPAEECVMVGDCSKALQTLGWRHTVSFDELIGLM
ncbi:MAG: GDP-mannose 4,6-dehydratase [Nitrospinota bacterium]|nr:GDP-mannose 4,6-dehydratase [Nitrospinota bacterium]MDH5757730.1 GDP-mannose 4,6-dehydratase [Nitrospinota bacterium]